MPPYALLSCMQDHTQTLKCMLKSTDVSNVMKNTTVTQVM